MDTIATEKRARMLSRSMAKSGIGVGAAPGEDGDAINDEIAGANEPTTQSGQDREDKECFRQRCPCAIPTQKAPLPIFLPVNMAVLRILYRKYVNKTL